MTTNEEPHQVEIGNALGAMLRHAEREGWTINTLADNIEAGAKGLAQMLRTFRGTPTELAEAMDRAVRGLLQ